VGLDFGSSYTRVVFCAIEGENIRYLGHGDAPVNSWSKGRLTDQAQLTESLRNALDEAEARAHISPEAAVIGVGGSATGINSRGVYEFGRKRQIEHDDMRYAVELAAFVPRTSRWMAARVFAILRAFPAPGSKLMCMC
jgi:cell division ATPase FtsA